MQRSSTNPRDGKFFGRSSDQKACTSLCVQVGQNSQALESSDKCEPLRPTGFALQSAGRVRPGADSFQKEI